MAKNKRKSSISLFLVTSLYWTLSGAHPGHEATVAHLNRQISLDQNNQLLLLERAWFYLLDNNLAAAKKDLSLAEKIGPALNVLYPRALWHLQNSQPKKSLDDLQQLLVSQPHHLKGLTLRAQVLTELGERQQAIDDYQKLITISPDPSPDLFIKAAGLARKINDDSQALHILDSGLQKKGNLIALQQAAIAIERDNRRPTEAILRLESMIANHPDNAQWQLDLAELQLEAGQPQLARVALQRTRLLITQHKTTPWLVRLKQRWQELDNQLKTVPGS